MSLFKWKGFGKKKKEKEDTGEVEEEYGTAEFTEEQELGGQGEEAPEPDVDEEDEGTGVKINYHGELLNPSRKDKREIYARIEQQTTTEELILIEKVLKESATHYETFQKLEDEGISLMVLVAFGFITEEDISGYRAYQAHGEQEAGVWGEPEQEATPQELEDDYEKEVYQTALNAPQRAYMEETEITLPEEAEEPPQTATEGSQTESKQPQEDASQKVLPVSDPVPEVEEVPAPEHETPDEQRGLFEPVEPVEGTPEEQSEQQTGTASATEQVEEHEEPQVLPTEGVESQEDEEQFLKGLGALDRLKKLSFMKAKEPAAEEEQTEGENMQAPEPEEESELERELVEPAGSQEPEDEEPEEKVRSVFIVDREGAFPECKGYVFHRVQRFDDILKYTSSKDNLLVITSDIPEDLHEGFGDWLVGLSEDNEAYRIVTRREKPVNHPMIETAIDVTQEGLDTYFEEYPDSKYGKMVLGKFRDISTMWG